MEYLEGRRSLSIIGENDTDKKADINRFIALVRKYQHNTELTDAMLYEFIDKVVVHAPTGGMGRYRQQQIDVYFSFIGNYMPDGAVISEEERIAQIDAIYEEKKKVKNQRQKKRAKERRASLKERVKTDPEAAAEREVFLREKAKTDPIAAQKIVDRRTRKNELARKATAEARIKATEAGKELANASA